MRRPLAAIAPALALLLGACAGDDPEPRFEAEPSSSPTSSPTTSPAAAEPEPWEAKTDSGAMAFVEHWINEFNSMRATGETSQIERLSTNNCETCTNFTQYTVEIFEAGGSIETEGWSLIAVSEPAEAGSVRPVISVRVDQAPQVLREATDADPQKFSGGKANFVAHLRWVGDSWRMNRLDAA